jgi:uncharacterized protein
VSGAGGVERDPAHDAPHLPHPAPIESYGNGGFRFAGMSHRGSLLCLPHGIWASPVKRAADITEGALDLVLTQAATIDHLLIGAGRDPWAVPPALRARLRESGLTVEAMSTGVAISTYNILLGEGRRVAALLVAVA